MTQATTSRQPPDRRADQGITGLSVAGFKSIRDEQYIDIRPLTILAGANSSGKSSFMQPLLLLKQTIEAPYDPGALLLDGPNITFTATGQLLSHGSRRGRSTALKIGIEAGSDSISMIYSLRTRSRGFDIAAMEYGDISRSGNGRASKVMLEPGPIDEASAGVELLIGRELHDIYRRAMVGEIRLRSARNRCFLEVEVLLSQDDGTYITLRHANITQGIEGWIRGVIHLPGLRGNPARTYPVSAVRSTFPGRFESYVATIISQWQDQQNHAVLGRLGDDLQQLGLTWKVEALPINDTQVELRVGRLAHATRSGTRDLVNIADVGFGVSQTLPVLVALRVAIPGQLVYLEQPEIHLHPRAQVALASVVADAVRRGVRVVAETHSSLFILAVQTLVAEGTLEPDLVKLHWFVRGEDGFTRVVSAELDDQGAFGAWPEDFADVSLVAQSRYLDAAERRMFQR